MAKKRKVVPTKVTGKLTSPPKSHNGQQLATLTEQQIAAVEACSDFPNQPTIQAVTKMLSADLATLDDMLARVAAMRSALTALEAARDAQIATVHRHRKSLESAITVACQGSAEAITSWGCVVRSRTLQPPSSAPPENLTVKASPATPGAVVMRVRAAPSAVSYLYHVSSDQNAVPTAAQSTISARARCDATGFEVGHALYVRAAVVRRNAGQSLWTDAVQVTVR